MRASLCAVSKSVLVCGLMRVMVLIMWTCEGRRVKLKTGFRSVNDLRLNPPMSHTTHNPPALLFQWVEPAVSVCVRGGQQRLCDYYVFIIAVEGLVCICVFNLHRTGKASLRCVCACVHPSRVSD